MRKKIAKFLGYFWTVIAIAYIVGFGYFFEWYLITAEGSKWMQALAMLVFFGCVALLFILHWLYGKLVRWIHK